MSIKEKKHFETLTKKYLTVMSSLKEIIIFCKFDNLNGWQLNKESFDWFDEIQYNQIESIKINNSNKIDSGCFVKFKNLKKLIFTDCNLIHLNKNLFDGLNNLEMLEFDKSKIEKIDSDAFSLLNNLRTLDITKRYDSNGLIFLEPKLFVSMADKLENLSFYCFERFDIDDLQEFKNRLGLRQETRVYTSGIGRFTFQLNNSNQNNI
jgi:Leucine-rich repeat (LRR) protein